MTAIFEPSPKYRDEDRMGTVTILCMRCGKDGSRGDIRDEKIREKMKKGWLCNTCKLLGKRNGENTKPG